METRVFVMAENALSDIPAVLSTYFSGQRPWIIADDNTWRAAGARLQEMLVNPHEPYIFPGTPMLHPDSAHADMLAGMMPENCVPLAVGSGVINDLVKRAAGVAGRPYCCVPTAASVDGYTSYGAALSAQGRKQTLPCPAPYAIVADIGILRDAPPDMLSSGYADLVTKIPAGADWKIVDALGLEPIVPAIWDLVQKDLRSWVADHTNLNNVFHGLAATGYAMQLYRESRPASGAEHLFSHVWEMEGLTCQGKDVSHGFKVSVGTLASVLLMEFVIDTDRATAQGVAIPGLSRSERLQEVEKLLCRGCYGNAGATAMEKFLEGPELKQRREQIWQIWDELRVKLKAQLLPYDEIRGLLKQADCPVTPGEIGLDREQFIHGIYAAQLIRKRYTILDLLHEAGLLPAAIQKLEKMITL